LEQLLDTVHSLGASAVGIAVTATFSQQQFATDLQLRFPLLSDWNREVSTAWGVSYDVWKGHQGVAKRSVFVIDTDGTVKYRWVTDDALVQPDYDELIAALRQLHG
jgi:peroxiredoxin